MKRAIVEYAVAVAVLILLPRAVLAQESEDTMSFTEEEAQKAPAEEKEAKPAESGGTSESDVLSALGGEAGATAASGGAAAQPTEGEQQPAEGGHPIWAVQQVYALRAGRVDLQPSFGISMNDPYVQHQSISVAGAYYITEVLAVGLSFNWYRYLDATTDLNFSVSRATHQTVPINEYFLGAQLNFLYVPLYGKFAFLRDWIIHWDLWVIGGGGFIFTRPIPVIDPEYRSFDYTMKFCFNVGAGARLYLARFLAVFVELRDYIFPEDLESLETYSTPEEREDKDKWTAEDIKLTNNVMLHVGVSLFIPFTFEYELPK